MAGWQGDFATLQPCNLAALLSGEKMIEQLIEAGRWIVSAGLAREWAGSLSCHCRGKILITRSGADLSRLTETDFVHVNPRTSGLQHRMPRPSSELKLHVGAYNARSDIGAVIHVHAPNAIGLGLLGRPLPALTPDFYRYLGAAVPILPFMLPASQGLMTAVSHILQTATAVLLQNHGVIVVGESVSQALLRLNLLEEQAGMYLAALAAGEPRILSAEDMRRLDEAVSAKRGT